MKLFGKNTADEKYVAISSECGVGYSVITTTIIMERNTPAGTCGARVNIV
jgi:hypothetical protein